MILFQMLQKHWKPKDMVLFSHDQCHSNSEENICLQFQSSLLPKVISEASFFHLFLKRNLQEGTNKSSTTCLKMCYSDD
ncbi:hypothetical protein Ahy_A07g032234 isoform B [Arachis hypogaea]|uniref:Uncharacterized protein n=1 Tax=Arachis hypogaea TaxID=3818 RepID=A0A445C6C3_ARAHY|nr:hypothetical protein Ahy_A07g032234 isoform B [Arachis hypogaea]